MTSITTVADKRAGDRRQSDRREADLPYQGEDRRMAERRSVRDRRVSAR